ncbi:MAG: hypothetical protein IRZ32_13420 [Solirubrobacteraceae bacterium]|nr:hypothetical protein [Solirubrobacteraceae bacterium]
MIGALALTYLVLLVAQAADIRVVNDWNPDTVIAWVLTTSPGSGVPREVIDGSYGFWSVLWFTHLTQSWPFHRTLWDLQPVALWVGTAACVTWAVWRLAGWRCAALTAALVLCLSTDVLLVMLKPTMHGQTVFAGAVMALYAVEVTRERPFGGPRRWIAASVFVALVAGVHLTDPQLWIAGILPLLAAVGTWWLMCRDHRGRRALLASAAVVAAAIATWLTARAAMRAAGYRERAPESTSPIDSLSELWAHARALFDMVLWLGNGALELSTAGVARGLLSAACALAIVIGVTLPIGLLVRLLMTKARRPDPGMLVHLVFWSVVEVTFAAAVVLTDLAEAPSVRYIVPMLLGAAATAPLLLRACVPAQVAAITGVAVIVTGSVVALADREIAGQAHAVRALVAEVERAAERTGATVGVGAYDFASNVTWATDGRVTSRPVIDWRTPICPFEVAVDQRWYTPDPSLRRSFVLWRGDRPPQGLGTPIEHVQLPGATMFVYRGDVRRRLC